MRGCFLTSLTEPSYRFTLDFDFFGFGFFFAFAVFSDRPSRAGPGSEGGASERTHPTNQLGHGNSMNADVW
jgi:hypothetical protein